MEEAHDFAPVWAVHSSTENQPRFRTWAPGEALAQQALEATRVEDGEDAARTEYWVVQMTRTELGMWQTLGRIPAGVGA